MNTKTEWTRALAIAVLGLAVSAAPKLRAVAGVGDTTIIVEDLTDVWKWPREFEQWTSLISSTREQIRRTDELIKIVGDPKLVADRLIESIPDLLAPVDEAIGLETRQHALNMSRELYSLGSVAVQTYKDANRVGPSYRAFGRTIERDRYRYGHYVMQEAMNARYKKAVEYSERVAKAELEVQRKALEQLKQAQTSSEIAVLHTTIAASNQRQDLARQRADQAKGELEAFRGQLQVEEKRKEEADREWSQAVVERMREKALAAYRTQMGIEDPTTGP